MAETIEQDLRMRWGDAPAWLIKVVDAAGAPVNITGCTMRFTAKLRATDADAAAVVTKTVGSGITLTTPLQGEATVALADTDMAALPPGRQHLLRYDCKMKLSGQTITVAYGTLLVEPATSRVV